MGSLSLRTKLIAGGVLIPALILLGLFIAFYAHEKKQVVEAVVDKSRILAMTVEANRVNMDQKWEKGLFTTEMIRDFVAQGQTDKALATIPVVAAWSSAMLNAEEGGYRFKVPKFQPRNSANTPDALESRALKR